GLRRRGVAEAARRSVRACRRRRPAVVVGAAQRGGVLHVFRNAGNCRARRRPRGGKDLSTGGCHPGGSAGDRAVRRARPGGADCLSHGGSEDDGGSSNRRLVGGVRGGTAVDVRGMAGVTGAERLDKPENRRPSPCSRASQLAHSSWSTSCASTK